MGGKRNQWLQQWAGEPTNPDIATLRFCNFDSAPAYRAHAIRSLNASAWISLPTFSGTNIGSVRGGLFPAARHALYAALASPLPEQKLSVFALGSSPSTWPWRCVATVKISRPF